MGTEARRRLEHDQQLLLRALVLGGPVPTGFDPSRLQLATRLLGERRWRQVERARPALALSLGPDGPSRFLSYAAHAPLPDAGAAADGLRFCQEAVDPCVLSDDARLEQAIARSRFRVAHGRVVGRRLPFLSRVRFLRSRRSVLVIRMPLVGTRMVGRVRRGEPRP